MAIRREHYLYDVSPGKTAADQRLTGGEPSSAKKTRTQFIRRKANTKIASPRVANVIPNRQKNTSAHRTDSLQKGILIKKQSNTRSQENLKGRQVGKTPQTSDRQVNLTYS